MRLKRYLPDGFIMGIILVILLAYIWPGAVRMINLDIVIRYGIMLLFFLYGLRLSPVRLKSDLKNWRLHLLIQSITFILFPAIVLLLYPLWKGTDNELLWMAIFFLAALPSTVSSSVVMVSIAEGNIPGAIFNASISGIIGIIVTPLWINFFADQQHQLLDFSEIIINLVVQILLPLIVGLFFHRFWGLWAQRNTGRLSLFDKFVILCIVYHSFSESFFNSIFSSISIHKLTLLAGGAISLFFVVFYLVKNLVSIMSFSRKDQITILFCGSKKSLVHGSVMATVLFTGSTAGSIFLIPVMIYHAFQLFYISIFAQRYRKKMP